tara:strand:- start:136 stop:423 length:288 start_codon:yes stop_codon:yes gene_type:complete
MAHLRVSHSGDSYRIKIENDEWVCSDGPMQRIFTLSLNSELPFRRYVSPVYPDPHNVAIKDAVLWLTRLGAVTVAEVYNSPTPDEFSSDGESVEY